MSKSISAGACLLGMYLLATGYASAISPLSGTEFRRICGSFVQHPYGSAGVPCSAYIHGFLGGAHASGKRLDRIDQEDPPKRSRFMDRATRTRLGPPIDRYGNYFRVGYCIPAEETLASVVERVVNYLNSKEPVENETANQLVMAALIRHYPCPKE